MISLFREFRVRARDFRGVLGILRALFRESNREPLIDSVILRGLFKTQAGNADVDASD